MSAGEGAMFWVGFRDLQWRLRRFIIGVVATALVFSLTLVLGGIAASFHNEIRRTVRAFAADAWIVPKGVAGPFTSTQFISGSEVAQVRRLAGVQEAAPLVLFRQTVYLPSVHDLNIIGADPGSIGLPQVRKGRTITGRGEMIVDSSLGKKIGSTIDLKGRPFHIVGLTHGLTYFGGIPVSYISLKDAQDLLFLGQPLASTIVTKGTPHAAPAGMQVLTNHDVKADLYRPIQQASGTIQVLDVLLLLIAAGIIGAILYMSSLERIKDFAVMKATGAGNGFVLAGLIAQALVLSATSAIVAIILAQLIAPLVPTQAEIPSSSYLVLALIAVIVGMLGSLAGLRRALSVDPALAFGG
jgi:putative ABC transport system permease protein